jgi:hypothetical protein
MAEISASEMGINTGLTQSNAETPELKSANIFGRALDIAFRLAKNPKLQALGVAVGLAAATALTGVPHGAEIAVAGGMTAAGTSFSEDPTKRLIGGAIGFAAGVTGVEVLPHAPHIGDTVKSALEVKGAGMLSAADDVAFGAASSAAELSRRGIMKFVRFAVGSRMTPKI